MRALLALLLLGGCSASTLTGSGSSRPAVTPMLSELPAEAADRDAVLDSSHHQATPEQHGKLAPKERQAETVAATAAAVLGSLFSKTQNVTLGTATVLDPVKPARPRRPGASSDDAAAPPPEEPVDADGLVPWIRLQPQPSPE